MNDKVYCDICGSDLFTIDEHGDIVCLQCGEVLGEQELFDLELADTAYMN